MFLNHSAVVCDYEVVLERKLVIETTFTFPPLSLSLSLTHSITLSITLQNATLAGGVGIGSCCNLMVNPGGALLVGTVAGVFCTLGMHFGSPLLARAFRVHDVSSVHNLHGLPAFVAIIARWGRRRRTMYRGDHRGSIGGPVGRTRMLFTK